MSRCPFGLVAAMVTLVPALAEAQGAPPPKKNQTPSNSSFVLSRQSSSASAADAARSRARQGDCKAALDLYDEALRTGTDPDIRRDRGLCHATMGNVFPA